MGFYMPENVHDPARNEGVFAACKWKTDVEQHSGHWRFFQWITGYGSNSRADDSAIDRYIYVHEEEVGLKLPSSASGPMLPASKYERSRAVFEAYSIDYAGGRMALVLELILVYPSSTHQPC